MDLYGLSVTAMTLKETPKIGSLEVSNELSGNFVLTLKDVIDKNNAILFTLSISICGLITSFISSGNSFNLE